MTVRVCVCVCSNFVKLSIQTLPICKSAARFTVNGIIIVCVCVDCRQTVNHRLCAWKLLFGKWRESASAYTVHTWLHFNKLARTRPFNEHTHNQWQSQYPSYNKDINKDRLDACLWSWWRIKRFWRLILKEYWIDRVYNVFDWNLQVFLLVAAAAAAAVFLSIGRLVCSFKSFIYVIIVNLY